MPRFLHSNAKRAIDSEIDLVLHCFGLYSKKYNFPQKIEILNQIGLITPRIVSKVISRRNYLEHEYKIPDKEQVEDAIDVANLFILTLEGALNPFTNYFTIASLFPEDHECYNPKEGNSSKNFQKEIYVEIYFKEKMIDLTGYVYEKNSSTIRGDHPMRAIGASKVLSKDKGYTKILALANRCRFGTMDCKLLYENLINSLM